VLDRPAFRGIVEEAKAEKLAPPYHVYARTAIYPGPNIEFYQIPDRILEKLGFNETVQPYTDRGSIEGAAA
jgi:adenine-specific DNA-methyltransferase